MSEIHKVKCDFCRTTVNLKWNSEHWIIPTNWSELITDGRMEDEHICNKCKPKKKKSVEVVEDVE